MKDTKTIVDYYTDLIYAKLDNLYEEIIDSIDKFNEYLIDKTKEYQSAKEEISIAIKSDCIDQIIDIIDKINENDLISDKINLKQAIITEILDSMNTAGEVSNIINDIKTELESHDDITYLIGIIQDNVLLKMKEYSQLTANGFLIGNPYLDMYIGSRNEFVEYTEKIIKDIVEVDTNSIDNKEVKTIKFKQRLRCTYDELQKFARSQGYEDTRQGNTTHVIWKHKETGKSMPIPSKSGTIPQGTVSRILKQMELTRNDLANFLYNQ